MAGRAPVGVPGLRPALARVAPRPQGRRRHHVVHVQADPGEPVGPSAVKGRDHHLQRPHEMRSQLDHQLALQQRFANEAEIEVLQVAQPAVDELGGAAARP